MPGSGRALQLAQLNVARMKYAMDDPEMSDFVDALDPVNAVADASPGFVWRLDGTDADGEEFIWGDPGWLVNMSVWENVDALKAFIRSDVHLAVMKRRGEWFSEAAEAYVVLWWVPAGHRPTIAEAQARLEALRANGPSAEAFNFASVFTPPVENTAATITL